MFYLFLLLLKLWMPTMVVSNTVHGTVQLFPASSWCRGRNLPRRSQTEDGTFWVTFFASNNGNWDTTVLMFAKSIPWSAGCNKYMRRKHISWWRFRCECFHIWISLLNVFMHACGWTNSAKAICSLPFSVKADMDDDKMNRYMVWHHTFAISVCSNGDIPSNHRVRKSYRLHHALLESLVPSLQ